MVASDMAIHVLGELGCRLPQRANLLRVLGCLLMLKSSVRKVSPEAVASNLRMVDERRIQAMKMLDRLVTMSYLNRSLMLPLAVVKSHRWSIQYGMCEYSPATFSLVALILMGKLKVSSVT